MKAGCKTQSTKSRCKRHPGTLVFVPWEKLETFQPESAEVVLLKKTMRITSIIGLMEEGPLKVIRAGPSR